jgi:hypothetical protein
MTYYDWPNIVSKLSNDDLARIITNESSEPELKVAATLTELKNRGIDGGNYHRLLESIKDKEPKLDENSPVLYSEKVIYTFSILFTVIFGAALFAANLKEVNKKKGILLVISFSILYTALSVLILNKVNIGTSGAVIFGAIGAIIINNLFWNKYIGKGIRYRKKRYKKPLIIALIIFIPLITFIVWAMIVTNQYQQ